MMAIKRGKFITLEGIEGVGKSTNLAFISRLLADRGIEHVTTREPGGTPLAEEIRRLLLDKSTETVDEVAELLLMFSARVQHVKNFILPQLNGGKWVVCDRFTDSSFAYQGGGRGINTDVISKLESIALGDFRSDLVLVLDISVESGLRRAENRSEKDRLEEESVAFFSRARQVFLDRAAQFPERYRVIDSEQVLSSVQTRIKEVIEEFINRSAC